MSEQHKAGDLVLRYYMGNPILGYILRLEYNAVEARHPNPIYVIEWMDAPDVTHTMYENFNVQVAKRMLKECMNDIK